MRFLAELLLSALIVGGASFVLIGAYGLLRLPATMPRLHAPTKASTLGLGAILLGAMGYALWSAGTLSIHELLIALFVFLNAPVTALFVAKTYLHLQPGLREQLPKPEGCDWRTYEAPHDESRPPG